MDAEDRAVSWPLLVVAGLCLLPVLGGVALLLNGGQALGMALIGFFGAGVFVLGRKAVTGN